MVEEDTMIPTILLCGGTGTRLREQTELRPKPLIQLGGKPLIYYIMKLYAYYGHTEFILALGYMQETLR
jgi:glucose-1-phosphate cytidylyltransferase